MDETRVEFFPPPDMIFGYMLEKSLNKIRAFNPDQNDYTLNDIIEFYNILKYIDLGIYTTNISEEDKKVFSENKTNLNRLVGKFCSTLDDSNIEQQADELYHSYGKHLWEIIEKYKIYNRISDATFKKLVEHKKSHIHFVLSHKKLVEKYDSSITECLLADDQSFEILLTKYLRKESKNEINLPSSLSPEIKERIVINYINSPHVNIGHLETISSFPVFDGFSISDETRMLAKEKYDEKVKEFFDNQQGLQFSTSMTAAFSKSQKKDVIYDYNGKELKISVSEKWITENLDNATLLNNFIHIYGLVDGESRLSHIAKPNQAGVIERLMSDPKFNKYYPTYGVFSIMNKFAVLQMVSYCEFLHNVCNIEIENVLQWFFDTYLVEEFGIDDFIVNMPSIGCTYLEKCRTICCEMEGLFKQFDSFVKFGEVKHDMIEISSKPVDIKHIGSLIEKKYLYPVGDECQGIMNLLFSDQNLLSYLPKREDTERYHTLYDLLLNVRVKYSEYELHQMRQIDYLIDHNILKIDEEGYVCFYDRKVIIILHDLYSNGFVSRMFYAPKGFSSTLTQLEKLGWITFGSTLFSDQESDYYNYYLNKTDFFNGSDLRNRYLHGTQRRRGKDSDLHRINYYTLLMLYIILVIKINDEFCNKGTQIPKEEN